MKKPLFWIPLFLCLLLSLSSCASPLKTDAEGSEVQNGNVTTGEVDCIDLRFFKESEIPLEPDKTDLPSYAVLSSITPGMTKEEVFSLVGNPQRVETRMISNRPGTSIAEKRSVTFMTAATGDPCLFFGVISACWKTIRWS